MTSLYNAEELLWKRTPLSFRTMLDISCFALAHLRLFTAASGSADGSLDSAISPVYCARGTQEDSFVAGGSIVEIAFLHALLPLPHSCPARVG